jgi:hypothetical protein
MLNAQRPMPNQRSDIFGLWHSTFVIDTVSPRTHSMAIASHFRRPLVLWWRDFRREPGAIAFLVLSLAITLSGVIVALSLNSAAIWRGLAFV